MPSNTTLEGSQFFVPYVLRQDQIARYHEEGYLVLGRTLTDEGLAQVRQEVTEVWEGKKAGFDPGKTWLRNTLMPNIHHDSPSARRCYFHGPVLDVVEQLIGPNLKGAGSQLTFKLRGNTQTVSWHQDNGYGELDPYNTISALTALDNCDQENGCLWVIPGSNKAGQLVKWQKLGHEFEEIHMQVDESKAVPVPLAAGETFVMHGWTLHKSDGNFSGERDRRILFFRYADADAVEVYNARKPRLGRLLRGQTRFNEVKNFEAALE
jgi:ectoine hydroxylase-related dioxygenase (phytanoyl-CoA dioxygenase family)